MASQWDGLATDFNSGMWMYTYTQQPFWDAQIKRLAEARGGDAPWSVVDVGCGMGRHTVRMLQAGASHVLAFDVSQDMVRGAKEEVCKFLQAEALPDSRVDVVLASATDCSSIPGAQEGTFDLALCVYVMCNLLSKEEVKRALAEILKLLKPGGKLMIMETHVIQYMSWNDEAAIPLMYKRGTPKEDGTKWGYFEDEGKPREIRVRMNSGREIKFTNRLYTLSTWVSMILEAGFQITQFSELHVDPKAIPADAPEYMKFAAGKPADMCWECTKPKD